MIFGIWCVMAEPSLSNLKTGNDLRLLFSLLYITLQVLLLLQYFTLLYGVVWYVMLLCDVVCYVVSLYVCVLDGMLCFCVVDGMAPTALHFLYLCPLSNLETGLGHCSWWPEGGKLAPLWHHTEVPHEVLVLYSSVLVLWYHTELPHQGTTPRYHPRGAG